jgi:hypothetical protein
MLKRYPPTNAPDTREYVEGLAGEVLLHPREIAIACCDSTRGVVRECMFKPTIADLARWCEREASRLLAAYQSADAEATTANALANAPRVVDRSNRPSIYELRERYGPTFGIKRVDVIDRIRGEPDDEERERCVKAERASQMIERNRRSILAEYARLELDPITARDGMLVSPSLLRSLDRLPHKRVDSRRASRDPVLNHRAGAD